MVTFELGDDLWIVLRRTDDGCKVMTVWDDKVQERRFTLDWAYAQALVDIIKGYEEEHPTEGDGLNNAKLRLLLDLIDEMAERWKNTGGKNWLNNPFKILLGEYRIRSANMGLEGDLDAKAELARMRKEGGE